MRSQRSRSFFTPEGDLALSAEETATAERQRAETERQRAETERLQNERLRAKLQELGIDPNTLTPPPGL